MYAVINTSMPFVVSSVGATGSSHVFDANHDYSVDIALSFGSKYAGTGTFSAHGTFPYAVWNDPLDHSAGTHEVAFACHMSNSFTTYHYGAVE
ncbi:MAG: hypothetical protein ACRDKI_01985 [Solirubrobacterales bacterium]